MTNIIDWILDLFRDPVLAQEFIADPDKAMCTAGMQNASSAQIHAMAATVAPSAVFGAGDPVFGLQHAVAKSHGITFAPQYQTQVFSHNDSDVACNNEFSSPDQAAGANAQNGTFNLGFGDITFGDKTTNTATDGGVVNTGTADDIDTTNVGGDGNVVGDDIENVNTGDIEDSNVAVGEDNDIDDSNDQTAMDNSADNSVDNSQDDSGQVNTTVDVDTGLF